MKETTRKYLGWGLLAFATATLLILPWIAVDFLRTKLIEHKEMREQKEIAKEMAIHHFEKEPYKEIFTYDDGDFAAEERVKIFKHMIESEPSPTTFIESFYNRVIGSKTETPAQRMLKEAYDHRPTKTKKLRDIYTLLKNEIGRKLFELAHFNAERIRKTGYSSTHEDSLSKLNKINVKKRPRRSNSDELRRKALKNSNPESFEKINAEILKNEFSHIKDTWKEDKSGAEHHAAKKLKI